MRNLNTLNILSVMLLMLIATNACNQKNASVIELNGLVPLPSVVVEIEGNFQINGRTSIFINSEELKKLGDYFAKQLGVNDLQVADEANENAIALAIDDGLPAQSYELEINTDNISIRGGDEAGLFYALQTLIQLKTEEGFPGVAILDSPRFGYRGMMLDVSRHFFAVEEIKTFLDMMALHKLNKFHWHLTDDQGWRIQIEKYPLLTEIGSKRKETIAGHAKESNEFDGIPYGGFYTQEEIREVISYAADRYIEVIPEIDMPGHSTATLAAYPNLSCKEGAYEVSTKWRVHKNILCPTEETFDFLQNVLAEVIELFPSQYIHIGGDEAVKEQWEGSEFCQNVIDSLDLKDEHGLQSYFIKRIEVFLNQNGKKLIGWDEILEGGLSPNATVMSWRGTKGGTKAATQEHDVIMTPNSHLYFDHYQDSVDATKKTPLAWGGLLPLKKVYSYEPMPSELSVEQQKYILGAQANLWTEYVPNFSHVQYMTLPRMAALSEVVWSNPERKNWEDFQTRLQDLFMIYDNNGFNYARHTLRTSTDQ